MPVIGSLWLSSRCFYDWCDECQDPDCLCGCHDGDEFRPGDEFMAW